MNRRTVLTTTGTALSISLAGCLDDAIGAVSDNSGTGSPDVSAADLEVTAGESATLTIEATGIAGLQIVLISDSDVIEFDFAEATLTPAPAFTYVMQPPFWRWDSRSDIELQIPITVAGDARPQEYRYGVRVIANDPDSESADQVEVNESPNFDEVKTRDEEFQILITE